MSAHADDDIAAVIDAAIAPESAGRYDGGGR
jgi:hypothetical protein